MGLALSWDILTKYMVYLHQDVFVYTLILVNEGFYERCCWVERKLVGSRIYPCVTQVVTSKLSETFRATVLHIFQGSHISSSMPTVHFIQRCRTGCYNRSRKLRVDDVALVKDLRCLCIKQVDFHGEQYIDGINYTLIV